jgi:tetratricopeptide (TPR) repeat protein
MVIFWTVLVAAGLLLTARPVLAFWNQLQGGNALHSYLYNLPAESGGFACLAQPLSEPAEREAVMQAIAQLEQSIQILPKQAHTYYLLGRAYCRLGDYAAAVKFLPRFTDLRPENPQADLELGFALERLCPPAGECEDLTTAQVWQRAGVLPEHLIANGEAARKQEDFEQALAWYRRAEQMGADLRSTMAYVEYQRALKAEKQEEAYAALQKAVEIDAGWADAEMRFMGWYRYARYIFEVRENFGLAMEILRNIESQYSGEIRLKSYISEVYRLLGWAYVIQKKFDTSEEYFAKAIEINPSNAWVYISYGKALFLQNPENIEQTISYFDYALELNNDNPHLWRSIYQFWILVDQTKQILEVCRRARVDGIADIINLCE